MKAVVVGATGLTGSLLVKKLAEKKEVTSVTALVRKKSGTENKKITCKTISFDEIGNSKFKADAAFSCLGTTIKSAGSRENFRHIDFTYNLEFAKVCRKNGVERFVLLSALGADPESSVFYSKVKGELEEEIKLLGFKSLSIIRPSLLEGPRSEWRTGEFIARMIMKAVNPFLVRRLKKYRSVDIEVLTDLMISEAMRKDYGLRIIESDRIKRAEK